MSVSLNGSFTFLEFLLSFSLFLLGVLVVSTELLKSYETTQWLFDGCNFLSN